LKKLERELNHLDFDNFGLTKNLLNKVHLDVLYFIRTKNLKDLLYVRDRISDFISINSLELSHGRGRAHHNSFRDILTLCDSNLS